MHHGLARPGHPAGPVHVGPLRQTLGTQLDRRLQPFRGRLISLGDIVVDGFELLDRRLEPNQVHHLFLDFAFSIALRARAMAWSCGTGGRGSASEAATFRFSHSR